MKNQKYTKQKNQIGLREIRGDHTNLSLVKQAT